MLLVSCPDTECSANHVKLMTIVGGSKILAQKDEIFLYKIAMGMYRTKLLVQHFAVTVGVQVTKPALAGKFFIASLTKIIVAYILHEHTAYTKALTKLCRDYDLLAVEDRCQVSRNFICTMSR